MQNSPLIVIVGPTASGKSDLAMQVARLYDGELICADSRTIYKGMDIGTAKPSVSDQKIVPHHLLDIVGTGEHFTAARFKGLANEAITDINSRGKLPIMVGGTGLYVDSILFDYQFGEQSDPVRRAKLEEMSIQELQQFCRDNNIEIPINDQNKRHLIRAIELGGLPKRTTVMRPNTLVVGIATEREALRERISRRTQAMVSAGIIDEVKQMGNKYGWESEPMTGNIYRIFRGVVEGTKSQQEAVEEFIRSDMALAKRQVTWLKRNPHIVWDTPAQLLGRIAAFVDVVKR